MVEGLFADFGGLDGDIENAFEIFLPDIFGEAARSDAQRATLPAVANGDRRVMAGRCGRQCIGLGFSAAGGAGAGVAGSLVIPC